jgi:hypothetical protein
MPREPRRIVTGHDAEGKSVIVIDGPPTPFGAYWLTDSIPVDNTKSGDAGQQVRKLEPPLAASIFRFAAIPPEDPNVAPEERERQAKTICPNGCRALPSGYQPPSGHA